MRLSIELTVEQHEELKARSDLSGQSIQEYVLARVFQDTDDDEAALFQLEAFLAPRIHDAQAVSAKSVKQVFEVTRVAVAN
jgi:hypothetical protein